jgi:hypothetical protein
LALALPATAFPVSFPAIPVLDVETVELNKFRATLRKQGVSLSPFPLETVEERRRGLLESADRLRNALSEDDWRVLEQAGMRYLR